MTFLIHMLKSVTCIVAIYMLQYIMYSWLNFNVVVIIVLNMTCPLTFSCIYRFDIFHSITKKKKKEKNDTIYKISRIYT